MRFFSRKCLTAITTLVVSTALSLSPALAAETPEAPASAHAEHGGVVKQKKAKGSPAQDVLYVIERLVPLTSHALRLPL